MSSCVACTSVASAQPVRQDARRGEVDVDIEVRVPDVHLRIETPPPAVVHAQADAPVQAQGTVAVRPPSLPWQVTLDAAFGALDDPGPTNHLAFAAGLGADLPLAGGFAIGARGQWLTWGDPPIDADGDGSDDVEEPNPSAWLVSAGPRFDWITGGGDGAFRLELGGGYRFDEREVATAGPFAELAIARDARGGSDDGSALRGGLALRLQQGFGRIEDFRSVLFGVQLGIDHRGPPAGASAENHFSYVLQPEFYAGWTLADEGVLEAGAGATGAGIAFGVPVAPWLEPRLRLDAFYRGNGNERDGMVSYAGLVGARFRFDPALPLYLDAAGGYAFHFDTPALSVGAGPLADVGVGLRYSPCTDAAVASEWGIHAGVRARVGLDGNRAADAIYLAFGFEYDARPHWRRCEPEPPPAPEPPPEPVPAPRPMPVVPQPVPVEPPPRVAPVPPPVQREPEPEPATNLDLRFRFGVDASTGLMDARGSTRHTARALGIPIDYMFSEGFGAGVRFQVLTGKDGPTDVNRDGFDDADEPNPGYITLTGGPRFRVFTDRDPDGRAGFSFDLGAGYAFAERDGDGSGPLVEAGVTRHIGGHFDEDSPTAADFGLWVRAQHGLFDAASYRALLVGVSGDLEVDIDPVPPHVEDAPASFPYVFGLDGSFGIAYQPTEPIGDGGLVGLGAHFGVPVVPAIEPRVRFAVGGRSVGEGNDGRVDPWVQGLLGVNLRFDNVLPVNLGALVGFQANFGATGLYLRDRALVDLSIGTRIPSACGEADHAIDVGLHWLKGLSGSELDAISLTVGFEYAGGPSQLRNPLWCRTDRALLLGSGGTANSSGHVSGEGHVEVGTVSPPRTIEIPLGMSLFGGALQVSIDPSLFPIEDLRRAGFVDVRIEGPAQALAGVEAQLRASLEPRGVRIHSVARVATTSPTVRAVITLGPPGATR